MLTSSSGTNYFVNQHEDLGQYGPYAIPSDTIACYHHQASLMDLSDKIS